MREDRSAPGSPEPGRENEGREVYPLGLYVGDAAALAAIHEDDVNVCVWTRPPPAEACAFAQRTLAPLDLNRAISSDDPRRAALALLSGMQEGGAGPLVDDITWLTELYADLFGASEFGLRLHASGRAMCPGFHVDRVGVRLVCAYAGAGTEWLREPHVDRSALARRDVAAVQRTTSVERLTVGAVGLLKGEAWPGNTGRGAVHRSPVLAEGQRRVLLTIEGW